MPIARVAFFLAYENLFTTLKRRTADRRNPYGRPPKLDFEQMVAYIETHYGSLRKADFIAVANFSHYNRQLGGLNRMATTIHVESFLPREERRRRQSSPGKKYVYKDYADMRLALEVGKHLASRPADVYLIGSGDGAFAAVARALIQTGKRAIFLIPSAEAADSALLHDFEWIEYESIAAEFPKEEPEPEPTPEPTPPAPDEVDRFCETLAALRRELTTAIPVDLMIAIYGPQRGEELIRKAQGRGLIDLWDNPEGLPCLSLQSERLHGLVQKMTTRPEVAENARLLATVARIAADAPRHMDIPAWRRSLRGQGYSTKQAKAILQHLIDLGILDYAHLNHPNLSLESVLRFLRSHN